MYMPKYGGNRCRSGGKRDKRIPGSRSWICAGQRAWLQPGGCALMGCRCPISRGQGWAKAQPGHMRTGTKRESRNRKNTSANLTCQSFDMNVITLHCGHCFGNT